MKLEEKLVQLRKEKGLTQLELAESLKVSRQAVSKWESGGAIPSTDSLRGLSELYGVLLTSCSMIVRQKQGDAILTLKKRKAIPQNLLWTGKQR